MIRRALRPLARELAIAYYRWALAEISPMHPDVPYIVHRLRRLLDDQYARPCYLRRVAQWL